ncbi:MAG: integration host factor subunit beta [Desulfuromonadales bacterium]|nr:integration host factor subunit beta [Desulfuromonadales bacterium]
MTKTKLIEKIAFEKKLTYAVAEKIIQEIFNGMADTLISGGRIEIRGFGSFEMREYGGYTGRNPNTGIKIEVKPKKLPSFKVGRDLKDRIMKFSS